MLVKYADSGCQIIPPSHESICQNNPPNIASKQMTPPRYPCIPNQGHHSTPRTSRKKNHGEPTRRSSLFGGGFIQKREGQCLEQEDTVSKRHVCLLLVSPHLYIGGLQLPLNQKGVGPPIARVCSKQQFSLSDIKVYRTNISLETNPMINTCTERYKTTLGPNKTIEVVNLNSFAS